MEGLEINIVFKSTLIKNKDVRYDSDFWTQETFKNPKLIYKKINEVLDYSQYGISIDMNEEKIGYPIYRMNEIHNMLTDLEVKKFANLNEIEIDKFKLNDRDVLFNRTNSYEMVGRTGVFYSNTDSSMTFASYLVRFIPNNKIVIPEYLCSFLNTKYGQKEIKRRSRHSINQTNVNPEEVKDIEIPILTINLQKKIEFLFLNANNNRLDSSNLYSKAEQLLLKELNLDNFQLSDKPINIKSFRQSFGSSGRLDAEYYQKKYEQIEEHIRSYKGGYSTFNNFIDNYSTGYPYKSDNYVENEENGIPLIRINNISNNSLDLSNCSFIPKEEVNLSPKDIAKENDILISMSGTIGSSCKIPKNITAVINQRIMRITPKNYNFEVLPLIINSIIGKFQLERIGTGGVQTNISSNDIKNILIPILDFPKQQEIANLVEESFKLRKQSEQLLEIAKTAVEKAIETDEDQAIKYINQQLKELKIEV